MLRWTKSADRQVAGFRVLIYIKSISKIHYIAVKLTIMRKSIFYFMILGTIAATSCTDAFYRKLPEGTFSSNDQRIVLGEDGKFILENYANVNDGRNFKIEGNYTSTQDLIDEDNDSYGKIAFTVEKVSLEGNQVSSLFLDEDSQSALSEVSAGDIMEGWWAYSENITWGGMMRVWFNWPGIARANNFYDGHNELFSGDPD